MNLTMSKNTEKCFKEQKLTLFILDIIILRYVFSLYIVLWDTKLCKFF
jgi:hypothetical protein